MGRTFQCTAAEDQNVCRILRDLGYWIWPNRVAKVGRNLFLSSLVLRWSLVNLEFNRTGFIPVEFALDGRRSFIDAARCGDRPFVALLIVGRKVVFLSAPPLKHSVRRLTFP